MKKRQILWAIVFGSMLAITGCGDDPVDNGNGGEAGSGGSTGSGGSAGSGGTGGSAGSNGTASSTCEAICGSTCLFGGINPGGDFGLCVSTCEAEAPEFNDNCGPQMEGYLNCVVDDGCNIASLDCVAEATAWSVCQEG